MQEKARIHCRGSIERARPRQRGVFLPKTCPSEIVEALNGQVKLMLEREDIRRNIAAMGARPDYGTPQQFSDFVTAETAKFASIIDKEGLHLDVQ